MDFFISAQRQFQHLIKITIVKIALPIDAQGVSTHDLIQVRRMKVVLEQIQVRVELTGAEQYAAETLHGQIGDGE